MASRNAAVAGLVLGALLLWSGARESVAAPQALAATLAGLPLDTADSTEALRAKLTTGAAVLLY